MVSYVQQEFAKLNTKNKLKIENLHDGRPWVADYKHWNYEAARRATEVRFPSVPRPAGYFRSIWTNGHADVALQAIYKRAPDLTREGGSIPVTLTFAESLGVNVLLLPMGRGDDGAQYVSRAHVLAVSRIGVDVLFYLSRTARRTRSSTARTSSRA